MKRLAVFLLFLPLLLTAAVAEITLYQPKDRSTTLNDVILLKGGLKNAALVRVNGQTIKTAAGGNFNCSLILHPGKNLVEVGGTDRYRQTFARDLRLLSLVTFPDIEKLPDGKKHWARDPITWLATAGLIDGNPDGYYYPGNPISRGDLAVWVARIKRLPVSPVDKDIYYDVPKEQWRAPFVKAVVAAGFMKSYDNQTFGLDDPISRREAAGVAVITEGTTVIEKIKPLFVDVPKEEGGASPIYTAKESGLLIGVSKEIPVFDPNRALTRAEAAVLLSRFSLAARASAELADFTTGFSTGTLCRVNVPPEIVDFKLDPANVLAGEETMVKISAQIAARGDFAPVSKVKIDLTQIGGLPDAEMPLSKKLDNGNQLFSLKVPVKLDTSGSRKLTVTVIDRLAFESKKEATLLTLEK